MNGIASVTVQGKWASRKISTRIAVEDRSPLICHFNDFLNTAASWGIAHIFPKEIGARRGHFIWLLSGEFDAAVPEPRSYQTTQEKVF